MTNYYYNFDENKIKNRQKLLIVPAVFRFFFFLTHPIMLIVQTTDEKIIV